MGNIINGSADYPIFNGKYEIVSLIDSGRAAHVYLGRSIKDPKVEVAIKINKKNKMCTSQAIKMARSEMKIHERMGHKNVIKIIDFGEHGKITKPNRESVDELFFIVMEYMPLGALYNVVQNHTGGIGEDASRFFMQQILNTVKYMHDVTVAHRDLKLENILLNDKM
jgi:serine/threonine protein kinase